MGASFQKLSMKAKILKYENPPSRQNLIVSVEINLVNVKDFYLRKRLKGLAFVIILSILIEMLFWQYIFYFNTVKKFDFKIYLRKILQEIFF